MFHVPSIDQIFKFLKRPINAVEGLNVSLVVTMKLLFIHSNVYVGLKIFLCTYSMFLCDPWWALRGNPRSVDVGMQASRLIYQQVRIE
jgi:hypothetical protein